MVGKYEKEVIVLLNFKVRRAGLFIILLLALEIGLCSVLTLAAEGSTKLVIHYHRPDQEYGPWNLWIWPFGQEGRVYYFTGEDSFGKVAEVELPGVYDAVGFIVRTNSWRKDVAKDRFVSEFTDGRAEIWLISGDPNIYFSLPDLGKKEAFQTQEPSSQVILGRLTDYVEMDRETVRFFFTTNPGANLRFYLGEVSGKLELVKTIENFAPQAGIEFKGLKPGVTYYYKVLSTYNGKSAESQVYSLIKSDTARTGQVADWAKTAVFYEIFVRSFYDGDEDGVGDFKGLKEKIGYLKSLGIDGVWLMPVFVSPSYHGYDVIDYYKINSDYGTIEDFREFLTAAHNNGIKVILDLVVNHTSNRHPWFSEAVKNKAGKYRDYYLWAEPYEDLKLGPWGQNIWHESPYGGQYMGIFGSHMPDLNLRNPAVREEMKKIARYWLDPNGDGDTSDGVDGFRLDAAMYIDHLHLDITHKWWQEFNAYVKSVNPDAFLVGENWTNAETVATFFADMDSSFNFDLAGKIAHLARGDYRDLLQIIDSIHQAYTQVSLDFIDSTFLTNHDQNRIATQLGGDLERAKLAAALLLTLPGTPFIYYGEEIGQLGAKPDEHIREPFDWYAEANGRGMTDLSRWTGREPIYTQPLDGISVEEQENDPDSLLNYYRRLIRIRKNHPAFFNGKYEKLDTPDGIYGYRIKGDGYELWVMHNYQKTEGTVEIKPGGVELLSGEKTAKWMVIKPYGSLILKFTR